MTVCQSVYVFKQEMIPWSRTNIWVPFRSPPKSPFRRVEQWLTFSRQWHLIDARLQCPDKLSERIVPILMGWFGFAFMHFAHSRFAFLQNVLFCACSYFELSENAHICPFRVVGKRMLCSRLDEILLITFLFASRLSLRLWRNHEIHGYVCERIFLKVRTSPYSTQTVTAEITWLCTTPNISQWRPSIGCGDGLCSTIAFPGGRTGTRLVLSVNLPHSLRIIFLPTAPLEFSCIKYIPWRSCSVYLSDWESFDLSKS